MTHHRISLPHPEGQMLQAHETPVVPGRARTAQSLSEVCGLGHRAGHLARGRWGQAGGGFRVRGRVQGHVGGAASFFRMWCVPVLKGEGVGVFSSLMFQMRHITSWEGPFVTCWRGHHPTRFVTERE